MPTARHLLVASLSLLAAGAAAQTHYAWVGTYNPNGEGLYRFTVDSQTGALRDKALVAKLPNLPSSPSRRMAKPCTPPAKWTRAWFRRGASAATAN